VRCVLGLFEGVATGAADGYARMADKPASTLLHLGPGLANGLAAGLSSEGPYLIDLML
jgi:acetolactate synthase I/II/III large subunit